MLDFKKIESISGQIAECDAGIKKMKQLATKLTDLGSGVDVTISINFPGQKPPEPKKDTHGRNNVEQPIMFMGSFEEFKQQIYTQPKSVMTESQEIKQEGMPPELALIMFDKMKAFYEGKKIVLEREFNLLVLSHQEEQLKQIE